MNIPTYNQQLNSNANIGTGINNTQIINQPLKQIQDITLKLKQFNFESDYYESLNTLDENIERIQNEYKDKPLELNNAFDSFKKGFINKIKSSKLKYLLNQQYQSKVAPIIQSSQELYIKQVNNRYKANIYKRVDSLKKNLTKNVQGFLNSNEPQKNFKNFQNGLADLEQLLSSQDFGGDFFFEPEKQIQIRDDLVQEAVVNVISQQMEQSEDPLYFMNQFNNGGYSIQILDNDNKPTDIAVKDLISPILLPQIQKQMKQEYNAILKQKNLLEDTEIKAEKNKAIKLFYTLGDRVKNKQINLQELDKYRYLFTTNGESKKFEALRNGLLENITVTPETTNQLNNAIVNEDTVAIDNLLENGKITLSIHNDSLQAIEDNKKIHLKEIMRETLDKWKFLNDVFPLEQQATNKLIINLNRYKATGFTNEQIKEKLSSDIEEFFFTKENKIFSDIGLKQSDFSNKEAFENKIKEKFPVINMNNNLTAEQKEKIYYDKYKHNMTFRLMYKMHALKFGEQK